MDLSLEPIGRSNWGRNQGPEQAREDILCPALVRLGSYPTTASVAEAEGLGYGSPVDAIDDLCPGALCWLGVLAQPPPSQAQPDEAQ